MTAQRALAVLIAAVAAIAGAFWLSTQRHMDRATFAGDEILPELHAALNDVTEVRMHRGDGSRVALVRKESGWIVAGRDYPADTVRVRRLLLDLAALEVVEEKTHDPANYAQLGVDEPTDPRSTATKLEAVAGPRTFALIVGKPSGAKTGFVRVPDLAASALASPQLQVDTDPKRWLDRALFDVRGERVQSVSVTAGDRSYVAARDSRTEPDLAVRDLPKGRALSNPGAATPLASSLADFTFDDVRAATTDATLQRAATFRTFDGLVVEMHGFEDGDRRWIRFTARYDAAQRKPYETAAGSRTDSKPLLPIASDLEALATRLASRAQGHEFEVASYKYDALFKPLDELLAPQTVR